MPENKGDEFLSPEIVKLSEKLQKDPSSRLFFPLAEEYIKCGMHEEAVMVLKEGLKIHPGFTAARVSLGKVYLLRGQVAEAKAEFEKVVAQNPDNLMAQKKLAQIYRDEGNIEKSMQICDAILSINAKDPEILKLKSELGTKQDKPAMEVSSHAPPVETVTAQMAQQITPEVEASVPTGGESRAAVGSPDAVASTQPSEPPQPSPLSEPEAEAGRVYILDEVPDSIQLEGISQEIGGFTETVQKPDPASTGEHPQRAQPLPAGQAEAGPLSPTPFSGALPNEPAMDEVLAGDTDQEKIPVVELNLEESNEGLEEAIFSELLGANPPKYPVSAPGQPLDSRESTSLVSEEQAEEEEIATVGLAELYVKQGHYEQGIEIYRRILEQDPENAEVRQRLEDALALANLLTKRPRGTTPQQKIPGDAPAASGRSPVEDLRQAKIQRLQAWLEQLKRSQNP